VKTSYDVLFLSHTGIGNTLEMMYAVEYCLHNGVKAGIHIYNANKSFEQYLTQCYGEEVILTSTENVKVKNLVHTFIVDNAFDIEFENYLYVFPDRNSTRYESETEQYLSVVRAIYPSEYDSEVLTMLRANYSERLKALDIENKYVIYTGCSSFAPVRRWPHYSELIGQLGEDNVMVVGGNDDLNDQYAYKYKRVVGKVVPYQLTNKKRFWNLCKKLHLLEPYAHNQKFKNLEYSYFNTFEWGELVALFQHCKGFIGNDGGLMHLASAAGASGIAIFGPTSVAKSRSYNPKVKEIYREYDCQPCHFHVGKVTIGDYYISCPYGVKCLSTLSPRDVLDAVEKV